MKKNKALAVAMASLAVTGMLAGCDPIKENVTCVYGPPPVCENDNANKNGDTEPNEELEIPDPLYGPPVVDEVPKEFEPEENIPDDIYGPPAAEEEPEDFRPQDNDAVAIYGPPGIMMD